MGADQGMNRFGVPGMVATHVSKLVGELRGALEIRDTANLSDADLWKRYVQEQDHAAFEGLVLRHGAMVLGVCRRILRNEQDAEDAFQATFLVLIRRAASIQSPRTIANWLHGVAHRTALEARTAATRRRAKEAAVIPRMEVQEEPRAELWPVLEQELGRLGEHHRAAVILCDLEGKTRTEAARQLGWAEGTVASRLARGRNILAKRLTRRGFAGALTAFALVNSAASANDSFGQVCKSLAERCLSLDRGESDRFLISQQVITLTEGVIKSMSLTKIKTTMAAIVVLAIAALGAVMAISDSQATEPGRLARPSG
jgi:RNA polymerase sigma factor (sigma-70 family)